MSKDLKSQAFVEANLKGIVTLNETNSFNIPADLYEKHVLEPAGITMEQENKKEKLAADLFSAMALHTGTLSAERFKEDPNVTELAFSYPMGKHATASGVFNREGSDHIVLSMTSKWETAEMKRVCGHVNSLFDDISN